MNLDHSLGFPWLVRLMVDANVVSMVSIVIGGYHHVTKIGQKSLNSFDLLNEKISSKLIKPPKTSFVEQSKKTRWFFDIVVGFLVFRPFLRPPL